ncbi:Hypothetical_protein [Hexamita inflata]|uniref:Hypothetical_protein n=1 Tax=Hexamita inflata TaxID=28002 RepID=A0AA86UAU7_9EUKA|nr:Hypothetical protein HINF_LOCUS35879 [Hexamita inflata]
MKRQKQIFETENKQVQNKQTNEKICQDKQEVFNPFARLPKNQFNTDYIPQNNTKQCENKQNEANQKGQQIQPIQSPKIITETAQNQQIPFKWIQVNPNLNIADQAEANVVQNDTTRYFRINQKYMNKMDNNPYNSQRVLQNQLKTNKYFLILNFPKIKKYSSQSFSIQFSQQTHREHSELK